MIVVIPELLAQTLTQDQDLPCRALWGRSLDSGDVIKIESLDPSSDMEQVARWQLNLTGGEEEPALVLSRREGELVAGCGLEPVNVEISRHADLFARQRGLLEAPLLADKRVLIVGLGSMGSEIARALAMTGVGAFRLLDKDRLSMANLSRHIGGVNDVGRRKTAVVADVIRAHSPAARVEIVDADFVALDLEESRQVFANVDLAICAADEERARIKFATLALEAGVGHLFTGCYEAASGGQVFYWMPGWGGPCYFCFLAGAQGPESGRRGGVDYSTATSIFDLPSQPALHLDIASVSLVASKVAISLLAVGSAPPDQLDLLNPDKTLFLVGNHAGPPCFTRPLETLFVTTSRNASCSCCQEASVEDQASY